MRIKNLATEVLRHLREPKMSRRHEPHHLREFKMSRQPVPHHHHRVDKSREIEFLQQHMSSRVKVPTTTSATSAISATA